MTILEYLDAKYPDAIERKRGKTKWQLFTMTEYVDLLSDIMQYLKTNGYVEMMTGMLQHDFYGYVFVKQDSHVSVSTSIKGQVDYVRMFVTIEQLFE
jgi:hypothetical protein